MATIDFDNQPLLAPAIAAGLGTLRRRLRQYVWLEGCGTAVAWLGAAFWATLCIDWLFEPTAAVRMTMLAVVALVWTAVVVQRIGRRAFVRISDSNAATVLERRFPQLNDSLLTAVMLTAQPTDPAEVHHELLAQTCREAAAHMAQLDAHTCGPVVLTYGGKQPDHRVTRIAGFVRHQAVDIIARLVR